MRQPRGYRNHDFAPSIWRRTPNITGDYEMDASIVHCKNKAVPGKLRTHLLNDSAYGPRTAYDGYDGYRGDN